MNKNPVFIFSDKAEFAYDRPSSVKRRPLPDYPRPSSIKLLCGKTWNRAL